MNEHKTTVEKAIKAFEKEGYVLIKCPENLCELKYVKDDNVLYALTLFLL